MQLDTRTAWAGRLSSAIQHQIPFSFPQYSTLNEKLGIQSGVAVPTGQYPKSGYLAIGNKGHSFSVGTEGVAVLKVLQHKATDAALFNQIPFILRQEDDDISPAQRSLYALRKIITVGNVNYIAYYLRRVDLSSASVETVIETTVDGVTSAKPFVPTASNLSPTPVSTDPLGTGSNVAVLTGESIINKVEIPMVFTPEDVSECINACEILYGSDEYAMISEIGWCSGYDKTITIQASTGSFNFNEAIAVQVLNFIGAAHHLKYISGGFSRTFNVGSDYPLYNLTT